MNFTGGACTHLHLLSSESRKYFQNGIPMSGTAFNYWSMSRKPNHTDEAFKMAADWKQPQQNLTSLLHVLKSVPAVDFIEYSRIPIGLTVEIKFGPVIEGTRNSSAIVSCLRHVVEFFSMNFVVILVRFKCSAAIFIRNTRKGARTFGCS